MIIITNVKKEEIYSYNRQFLSSTMNCVCFSSNGLRQYHIYHFISKSIHYDDDYCYYDNLLLRFISLSFSFDSSFCCEWDFLSFPQFRCVFFLSVWWSVLIFRTIDECATPIAIFLSRFWFSMDIKMWASASRAKTLKGTQQQWVKIQRSGKKEHCHILRLVVVSHGHRMDQ